MLEGSEVVILRSVVFSGRAVRYPWETFRRLGGRRVSRLSPGIESIVYWGSFGQVF